MTNIVNRENSRVFPSASRFESSQTARWCLVACTPSMVSVEGLDREWEGNDKIRARIRETKCVIARPEGHAWCDGNRHNCVANDFVILPVLHRMREDDRKLPHLDPLRCEVAGLYHRLSITSSEKELYTMSVEIKKLCSFVKRRCSRKEVTKDML